MQRVDGITELLDKWSRGDKAALDQLMPLVYDELRRLAKSYLRRQRQNHTLQATALVNEAYLRLIGRSRSACRTGRSSLAWRRRRCGISWSIMPVRANVQTRWLEFMLSFSQADRLNTKPALDLVALDDALRDWRPSSRSTAF